MKNKKGFGLISLIIMLAMVGLIFWMMNKSLSKSFPATNNDGGSPTQGITAPINAAKDAKNLIESRYNASLEKE